MMPWETRLGRWEVVGQPTERTQRRAATAAASDSMGAAAGEIQVHAVVSPAEDRDSSEAEAGWSAKLEGKRVWNDGGTGAAPTNENFRITTASDWEWTLDLDGTGGRNVAKTNVSSTVSLSVDGNEVDSGTVVERNRRARPRYRDTKRGTKNLDSGGIDHTQNLSFKVEFTVTASAERVGESKGDAKLKVKTTVATAP